MQTQLIWSPALLQRFPGEERPCSRVEGADVKRNVSTQSLNSHYLLCQEVWSFFWQLPLWPHSEGFLLSSFCLEDELCPQLCVHASGARRCCPVLPCCETLSVSAGSSLQKMNHNLVWRVLVMTHGNLCLPPFTLVVWAGRVNWTEKKIRTYACVWTVQNLQLFHVSSSVWEGVSDSVAEEAHLSLFWQTLLQSKCFPGVRWARKADKSPYVTVLSIGFSSSDAQKREPCSSIQQFIVSDSFCYNPDLSRIYHLLFLQQFTALCS